MSLSIVLFAGGGGSSVGIEAGTGRAIDIAVNHSANAIRTHSANHPNTLHLTEDVFAVKPLEVCRGESVDVLWASPDCRHFSKAKGGKPVEKKIRGLAWVVVRWAKEVRPRVIFLENVEEFQDWGPLGPDGKPDKKRRGLTFRRFVGNLKSQGYQVEWRTLVAADYGAPTTRKRLYMVARCDGQPIVWPAPTHADPKKMDDDQADLFHCHCKESEYGVRRENRADPSARFVDEGPAGGRTTSSGSSDGIGVLQRVEDSDKADWVSEQKGVPSDVHHFAGGGRDADGAQDRLDIGERRSRSRVSDKSQGREQGEQRLDKPGSNKPGDQQRACAGERALEAEPRAEKRGRKDLGREYRRDTPPSCSGRDDEANRDAVRSNNVICSACGLRKSARLKPWRTAASCIDWSVPGKSIFERKKPLAEKTLRRIAAGLERFLFNDPNPFIVGIDNKSNGSGSVWSSGEPLRTVVTENRHAVVSPALVPLTHDGGEARVYPVQEPARTITAANRGEVALASPVLVPRYGEREGQPARAASVEQPMPTVVPTGNQGTLVAAHLTKFRGESTGCGAESPVPTITAGAGSKRPAGAAHALGVVGASLVGVGGRAGQSRPRSASEPLATITAKGDAALVVPHVQKFFGNGVVGREADAPLSTVTSVDHQALTSAFLTKYRGTSVGTKISDPIPTVSAQGNHVAEVRAFLVAYYGNDRDGQSLRSPMRTITAKDRLGIVTIHGEDYQIVDITLRMLRPGELLLAQGFPADYLLLGTGSEQVSLIGNSVCPPVAKALARANCGFMVEVEVAV